MMKLPRLVLAVGLLSFAGCGIRDTTSNYQVSHPDDKFTETVNGKTVSFANWQLSAGGKLIDIPEVASTITVRHARGCVTIEVNGKNVYQD